VTGGKTKARNDVFVGIKKEGLKSLLRIDGLERRDRGLGRRNLGFVRKKREGGFVNTSLESPKERKRQWGQ